MTVSVTYAVIAQFLPQLESHPPAVVELGANIGPEDLAAAGSEVFEANCAQCHKIGADGGRCPDLGQMGTLAKMVARGQEEIKEMKEGIDWYGSTWDP